VKLCTAIYHNDGNRKNVIHKYNIYDIGYAHHSSLAAAAAAV
jgi:hypothetical protein